MTGGSLSHLNRLSSAPYDVLNPTQFAGLIVTIFPYLYFLIWEDANRIYKLFFILLCPIILYVLLLTGARSGVICLFVVLLTIFLSKNDWKVNKKGIIFFTISTIVIFAIISSLLSPDFKERYLSIIDSSAKGHDTATGRLNGLKNGIKDLIHVRAVLGYGLGTSEEANYHTTGDTGRDHSLYLEAIQEIGIVGLILFFKLIQSIFKSLAKARKKLQEEFFECKWILNLAKAIQAWATMFLVYSIICFGLSSWEWYFFASLSALCQIYSEKKLC
ncbi:hypothetical protein DSCW_03900 [Desulfosarcina widdelii]|uniref:O-antigen ligase-related domain-containing protein n=2 Tax=Desulfosarcina widdelii TaxID=947919 RepID=A0A5K7YYH4_9BACT|nr:hypothetical protein DSCW_03900 [Desulfosarcina widdelii]